MEGKVGMSPWITSSPTLGSEIGPLTMIHHGKAISLASEVGALALLHGALQSAIATVDEAANAETTYRAALADLASAS